MKKLNSISTLLAGIVLGISISFSPQIYAAAGTLVGQEVGKIVEVKMNDKSIGQAAIIDGTSYLPVRNIAEGLNLSVDYTPTEITLTLPSSEEMAKKAKDEQDAMDKDTEEKNQLATKKSDLKNKIDVLNQDISALEQSISRRQSELDSLKSYTPTGDLMKKYTDSQIEKLGETLTNLQATLTQKKQELADLEAQLAALE